MNLLVDHIIEITGVNPFENWPWIMAEWGEAPLNREEVQEAIWARTFNKEHYPGPTYGFSPEWTRLDHVMRIAMLCVIKDLWCPIVVEFNELGGAELVDGNHRLAAAIFLGHFVIKTECCGFVPEQYRGRGASEED